MSKRLSALGDLNLALFGTRQTDHQPSRISRNVLLVNACAVIALHLENIPVAVLLMVTSMLAWRFLGDNYSWRMPGKVIRSLITLVAIYIILKEYHTIFGRDAGIALLVALVGLKLLEMRRLRDYLITVFLLYFLTLGAFLFIQPLWIGAYALGVAALSTISLIQLSQKNPMPMGQATRLTLGILFKAIPLMLVIYFLFPRIQGSLWGLPIDAHGGKTGLDEKVTPGSINDLVLDNRIAFRVEFEGDPPSNDKLYWRAMVFTHTNGRSWSRYPERVSQASEIVYEKSGASVDYTVTLEPTNHKWLVALDLPTSKPENSYVGSEYVFRTKMPISKRLRYQSSSSFDTTTIDPSPRQTNRALKLGSIPTQRVRNLVEQWQQRADKNIDVVNQALTYFNKNEFVYTLKPPKLGADPTDEFLFETRRGFCEHYAATFATLMRIAEIPSRLVVGYQGGEVNRTGNYLIVRQSDAHAWVEVWLADQGWIRIDPTAAVAPERIELGLEAVRELELQGRPIGQLDTSTIVNAIRPNWFTHNWHNAGLLWDAVNMTWTHWVIDYTPERQRDFLENLGFDTPDWLNLVLILAGAICLCFFVIAVIMLYPKNKLDPIVKTYQLFCKKLERRGVMRFDYEGPVDFAQRAAKTIPDSAEDIWSISDLYIQLRYGEQVSDGYGRELRKRVRGLILT